MERRKAIILFSPGQKERAAKLKRWQEAKFKKKLDALNCYKYHALYAKHKYILIILGYICQRKRWWRWMRGREH